MFRARRLGEDGDGTPCFDPAAEFEDLACGEDRSCASAEAIAEDEDGQQWLFPSPLLPGGLHRDRLVRARLPLRGRRPQPARAVGGGPRRAPRHRDLRGNLGRRCTHLCHRCQRLHQSTGAPGPPRPRDPAGHRARRPRRCRPLRGERPSLGREHHAVVSRRPSWRLAEHPNLRRPRRCPTKRHTQLALHLAEGRSAYVMPLPHHGA